MTQGLERDFIKWVQGAFTARGLRTDIMLLTPHTPPRNSVIQTHVLEGVIAVVDLDIKAQSTGKIPLQVFDRSAGAANVRFDGYQDLTPDLAADVVSRAKSAAMAHQQAQQPYYGQGYSAPAGYGQQYAPQAAAPAPSAPAAPANTQDLAALVGQLDNNTLMQLLGALQGPQAAAAYAQTPPAGQYQSAAAAAAQPPNLAALLSTLSATAPPQAPSAAPAGYGSMAPPYASAVPTAPSAPAAGYPPMPQGGTNEQTVQAIMAQFTKYRQ